MSKKYKMTGCAKFFIFLLIAVPAAYFISAYYHGEDGISLIKDKLGLDKTETVGREEANTQPVDNQETYELENTIKELEKRIDALEADLEEKDSEIEHLKQQLEATKGE